jgi:S1 RNA binding domain
MNQYEILKNIHKVGHRILGVVIGYEKFEYQGLVTYHVEVETHSKYKAILVYNNFEYDWLLTDDIIPEKGTTVEMVVRNFVDDILYLSAKPSGLEETEIQLYKDFYEVVETIKEGTVIEGKISKVVPFGLFVELENCPFIGLIDIGHSDFNRGKKLPINFSSWAKEGNNIKCIVSYFRFYNKQIGLGWLPDETN